MDLNTSTWRVVTPVAGWTLQGRNLSPNLQAQFCKLSDSLAFVFSSVKDLFCFVLFIDPLATTHH